MSGVCTKVNLKETSLTGVTSEETPVGGYVIRYIQDIADHAIDCTAAEPNRTGLENTMARCITALVHGVPKIGPKT